MPEWLISVAESRPIEEIAADLKAAGLTKAQVLRELGYIVGSAPDSAVPKLRKVKGVSGVEPSGEVELPPKDSPDTW